VKAFAHNGLVPMTIKQAFRNYRPGETVRFSPADAQKYLAADLIAAAKVSKDAKTVAVQVSEPGLVSDKILPQELPAIPEDWEQLHRLQRTKLAEQIAARPVTAAEADTVIKDELARRLAE
jgi:hypothetical protein